MFSSFLTPRNKTPLYNHRFFYNRRRPVLRLNFFEYFRIIPDGPGFYLVSLRTVPLPFSYKIPDGRKRQTTSAARYDPEES